MCFIIIYVSSSTENLFIAYMIKSDAFTSLCNTAYLKVCIVLHCTDMPWVYTAYSTGDGYRAAKRVWGYIVNPTLWHEYFLENGMFRVCSACTSNIRSTPEHCVDTWRYAPCMYSYKKIILYSIQIHVPKPPMPKQEIRPEIKNHSQYKRVPICWF